MTRMKLIVALLCAAGPALAEVPSVKVEHAWARATAAGQKVGGVFLTLTDTGPADRLVSVTSPIGDALELHETTAEGGVMRMRPVPMLALEAGRTIEFKPGGYHLMVFGLKQKLTEGETFPVTLTFEKAPPVTTVVVVGKAGASAPPDHMHP